MQIEVLTYFCLEYEYCYLYCVGKLEHCYLINDEHFYDDLLFHLIYLQLIALDNTCIL